MYCDEILEAIVAVHAGRRRIPAPIATRLAERVFGQELTASEMTVLELILTGQSNYEFAATLSITEPTLKVHVSNILSKLGVADRTEAVTVALQRGIIHFS